MRIIILMILCLVLPMQVNASNKKYQRHVDKTLAKMNKEARDKCKHIFNIKKSMRCEEKIEEKQALSGKRRGTEDYCQTHYLKLGNTALENKFDELDALRSTARGVGDPRTQFPGEMTQSLYAVELACIADELKRRGLLKTKLRRY